LSTHSLSVRTPYGLSSVIRLMPEAARQEQKSRGDVRSRDP
jgi:hypothetical protein